MLCHLLFQTQEAFFALHVTEETVGPRVPPHLLGNPQALEIIWMYSKGISSLFFPILGKKGKPSATFFTQTPQGLAGGPKKGLGEDGVAGGRSEATAPRSTPLLGHVSRIHTVLGNISVDCHLPPYGGVRGTRATTAARF